ncbi:hypothetical protein SAMN04488089_12014 [Myroides profundi]|uniref:Uncharacterized protein n=2 Tax=Myroides TaxID=76831 RepID=A0AAJ5BFE2_MYRPR|nr:hypothetical protein HMPREF9715_01148 [Myroides odoratimimus CIP 101113]SER58102.1 hypothetical protein SAMN04488089_12014 [Myroides profundi]
MLNLQAYLDEFVYKINRSYFGKSSLIGLLLPILPLMTNNGYTFFIFEYFKK